MACVVAAVGLVRSSGDAVMYSAAKQSHTSVVVIMGNPVNGMGWWFCRDMVVMWCRERVG